MSLEPFDVAELARVGLLEALASLIKDPPLRGGHVLGDNQGKRNDDTHQKQEVDALALRALMTLTCSLVLHTGIHSARGADAVCYGAAATEHVYAGTRRPTEYVPRVMNLALTAVLTLSDSASDSDFVDGITNEAANAETKSLSSGAN